MADRPGTQTLSRLRTGLLIREARHHAGLTQRELAARLGTKQSVVSRWERGVDTPRVDTLGRVLQACGFEADLTFRRHDDEDRSQIVESLALSPAQRLETVESVTELLGMARPRKLTMARPLKARELFATLERHAVNYVVIGGLAAVLHGSPTVTGDADVCPERSNRNLSRLAEALREMHARIRTSAEPDGREFACDGAFLSRMKMVNLTTDYGDFDLSFEPAGFTGYDELVADAVSVPIGAANVLVASLADVIRSKETADRPKDRATLPILYALQDEIAKGKRR